jgi:nitrate reductase NapE component
VPLVLPRNEQPEMDLKYDRQSYNHFLFLIKILYPINSV